MKREINLVKQHTNDSIPSIKSILYIYKWKLFTL